MTTVTVRLHNRWPWVIVAIFAVATVGVIIALVGLLTSTRVGWLQAVILAFLLVLFVGLGLMHIGVARSRLTITPTSISRNGPRAWSVTSAELEQVTLHDDRLALTVTGDAARSPALARAISETWWFAGGRGQRRLIATRVHPADVPTAKAALATFGSSPN